MKKKLTATEIELYTNQAREAYAELALPKDLLDKLILQDINAINKWLDWIAILEKEPTIDKAFESINYYSKRCKQLPGIYKELGFSDEQYQKLTAVALIKITHLEQVKNPWNKYNELVQTIIKKSFASGIKKDQLDFISDYSKSIAHYLENKETTTKAEEKLLKEALTVHEFIEEAKDDEELAQFLQMSEEDREKWKEEEEQDLQSVKPVLEAIQEVAKELSAAVAKFKLFKPAPDSSQSFRSLSKEVSASSSPEQSTTSLLRQQR